MGGSPSRSTEPARNEGKPPDPPATPAPTEPPNNEGRTPEPPNNEGRTPEPQRPTFFHSPYVMEEKRLRDLEDFYLDRAMLEHLREKLKRRAFYHSHRAFFHSPYVMLKRREKLEHLREELEHLREKLKRREEEEEERLREKLKRRAFFHFPFVLLKRRDLEERRRRAIFFSAWVMEELRRDLEDFYLDPVMEELRRDLEDFYLDPEEEERLRGRLERLRRVMEELRPDLEDFYLDPEKEERCRREEEEERLLSELMKHLPELKKHLPELKKNLSEMEERRRRAEEVERLRRVIDFFEFCEPKKHLSEEEERLCREEEEKRRRREEKERLRRVMFTFPRFEEEERLRRGLVYYTASFKSNQPPSSRPMVPQASMGPSSYSPFLPPDRHELDLEKSDSGDSGTDTRPGTGHNSYHEDVFSSFRMSDKLEEGRRRVIDFFEFCVDFDPLPLRRSQSMVFLRPQMAEIRSDVEKPPGRHIFKKTLVPELVTVNPPGEYQEDPGKPAGITVTLRDQAGAGAEAAAAA